MRYLTLALVILLSSSCATTITNTTAATEEAMPKDNPLLAEFTTPFGVPPFNLVTNEHYLPAFEYALDAHQKEIANLASNDAPPTFENTVAAMDFSGELLTRVASVFFNLQGAETNDYIQDLAKDIAPKLSEHSDKILMNAELFARIKKVYDSRAKANLTSEQNRLLEETYKEFVRGGAELSAEKKKELMGINQELSVLSLQFQDNLLKENNKFQLVIENKSDLAGLPENVVSAASEAAAQKKLDGKWLFTLHKPSLLPFLQFSEKRKLRQQMYEAYIRRGDNNDKLDSKAIISKITALRISKANILGFATHSDYVLADNMAERPAKVYELLNQLWTAALPVTKKEAHELQAMLSKENNKLKLEGWDWWFYAEKLRKERYNLSEEELRPYFVLKNVQQGAFDVATKLFGIKFAARADLPTYHEEVKAFEVLNKDGSHVGILYVDYFPRPGKRGGAWMNSYRKQYRKDGKMVTPVVTNVLNFSRPTGDTPALLSLEEVTTLFHEFGHALHGLLSDATYSGLSGTSVARDFVELPSQFMENWAVEPSVLRMYAKHYKTGVIIPDELITKIHKARHFNQGFETTEYLAASFLDMNWHTLEKNTDVDVNSFEKAALDKLGLIPQIAPRYRSTNFAHIFAGGYSSGYYAYIWAAVLDADAFQAFKEKDNLFDPATAKAFRDFILSKGNTEPPMELYKKFRGTEPKIDPLLERRGLKSSAKNTP